MLIQIKISRLDSFICNLCIIGLFLLFSCEKRDISSNGDSGKLTEVAFRLYTANTDILETKAGIQENLISNLWVLQFNGTSDASVLIKATYYTFPDISNLKLYLYNGASNSVYFIANLNNSNAFTPENAPLNSYSLILLKNRTISYSSQNSNFTISGDNQVIRMTGVYSGSIPGGAVLTAILYRLPARIDFSYTSIAAWDNAIVKINSVTLKNVPSTSKLLSNPDNSTVYEPASVFDYSSVTSGIGETSGTAIFYMPENIRGIVPINITPSDKALNAPVKSTYIEVSGNYYYPQSASNPIRSVLYKIYLGENNTTDYNIRSNTRYIVSASFKGIDMSDARITLP